MILHVVSLGGIGGVATSFVSVLESSMFRRSDQVAVVTCPDHSPFLEVCRRNSDRVARLDPGSDRNIVSRYRARRSAWLAATRGETPGLVLFWNTLPSLPWFWLARRMFSDAAFAYYERGQGWLMPRSRRRRSVLSRMDAVVCNSGAAKRILEERWDLNDGMHVLRNPIPEAHSAPGATTRALDRSGHLRIGVAGRLIPVKGVALAIHAIRELDDRGLRCTLSVAGEGPLEESLKRLADRLGVASRCSWLGRVRDMPGFYRSIDLLLVPSLREPFGLISVEAQSWGVPVVVTRIDGLPETILEGATGHSVPPNLSIEEAERLGCDVSELPEFVYDPSSDELRAPRAPSPAALAEASMKICEDGDRYECMSRAASEHALATFGFSAYVDRFEELLIRMERAV